jgi:hypothetical protein
VYHYDTLVEVDSDGKDLSVHGGGGGDDDDDDDDDDDETSDQNDAELEDTVDVDVEDKSFMSTVAAVLDFADEWKDRNKAVLKQIKLHDKQKRQQRLSERQQRAQLKKIKTQKYFKRSSNNSSNLNAQQKHRIKKPFPLNNVDDLSPYNKDKCLVSVRRMRVITVMVEMTHKIPRLLQATHIATVSLLLTRLCLRDEYDNEDRHNAHCLKSAVSGVRSPPERVLSEWRASTGCGRLVEWAAAAVYCCAVSLKESADAASNNKLGRKEVTFVKFGFVLMFFHCENYVGRQCLLPCSSSNSSVP